MSGIILSFMLSYSLFNPSWSPSIPVDAEIIGGYHVGSFYAEVSLFTHAKQAVFGWAYNPLSIGYDFRLGIYWQGFNIYLSRFCDHSVSGGSRRYPEDMGLRIIAQWSTWPRD